MKCIRLAFACLFIAIICSCNSTEKKPDVSVVSVSDSAPAHYDVAVYYFPQWHVDAKNVKKYGRDWTEWEVLQAAKPKFAGHIQPKVPLWGYEDEADPKVMSKKIDVAVANGINVFLFDWYYNNDGQFLQRPLEEAFMKTNNNRMKFAIMWANHQKIKPVIFDSVMDICINKYFKDPSYWMIDGAPYFCLYQLYTFIESFGSVEKAKEALQRFRAKTIAAGFKDLHFNAMQWGLHMPDSMPAKDANELIDIFGVNSVDTYVWIHHTDPAFPTDTYDNLMDKAFRYWDSAYTGFKVPYHPNVTMGWDPTPRCDQNKPWKKGEYPYTGVLVGNTPEKFKVSLQRAKDFLDKKNPKHKIVTINSWNEWTEGSYLEPDTLNKMQYLEAIKDVFGMK
ncbi:MAG: glycoside hydrolase family 99-like domain-containing protein [Chitinophagaceae bacterium]|nr:glycoside hydrolase family 99-like domain-containing protein [Chitinophagaceae bacterium]